LIAVDQYIFSVLASNWPDEDDCLILNWLNILCLWDDGSFVLTLPIIMSAKFAGTVFVISFE